MNMVQKINTAFSNSKKAVTELTNVKNEMNTIINDAKFDYTSYNLPILYLTGDTTGMNKDDKVTLDYVYKELSGTCTVKWQGSSSLAYPKKNYTVTFDKPFEAHDGWGEQKKYCLKANYIDFSHARNIVCAKLWGQVVRSRAIKNERLYDLPNGGAIDGFPIMVVINDVYQGLYSFNIPKDKWMLGMSDDVSTNCILGANVHSAATQFKATALVDETDFEAEYVPNEDDYQWVIESLNRLINACMNNSGALFENAVSPYIDLDSAIDYYIFTCLVTGADMTDKNYLLGTFDGVKWFFNAYDMDTTFGNHWAGTAYYQVAYGPTFRQFSNTHQLMHLIYTYTPEKLKARYKQLRKDALSLSNVYYMFYNYSVNIPKALLDEEVKIWTKLPGTNTNNIDQIMTNYRLRCEMLDNEIENL